MFKSFTEEIVSNMEKEHKNQPDLIDTYKYGLNQFIDALLNILTFLLIGLIFTMLMETLVFTIAYIPLRQYAGGFHCKTSFRCWIVSGIMLVMALLFQKFTDSNTLYAVLALFGSIMIILLSPVEDSNKPLDALEKKVYKKRCLVIWMVEVAIAIILRFFQMYTLLHCVEIVWATLSIMLILGMVKNRLCKMG